MTWYGYILGGGAIIAGFVWLMIWLTGASRRGDSFGIPREELPERPSLTEPDGELPGRECPQSSETAA